MKIVFDPKLCRPGCIILQALGGDVPSLTFHRLFPTETWLTHPTPDMKLFEVTGDQLEILSRKVKA